MTTIEAAIELTDHERRVLRVLAEGYGEQCYYFRTISRDTELDRAQVRDACRSLAGKGLAYFMRGLFTEDGETAGSGYGATDAGLDVAKAGA